MSKFLIGLPAGYKLMLPLGFAVLLKLGKMVLNLCANIDLPDPGEPIIKTWCPAATAISKLILALLPLT